MRFVDDVVMFVLFCVCRACLFVCVCLCVVLFALCSLCCYCCVCLYVPFSCGVVCAAFAVRDVLCVPVGGAVVAACLICVLCVLLCVKCACLIALRAVVCVPVLFNVCV